MKPIFYCVAFRKLADAIAALFNHAGGPVEFDELVGTVAALQGISDQPIESLAADDDGPGIFKGVTFIQRVNTKGGLRPTEPGTTVGELREVEYTAEYYFYKAENPSGN